MKSDSSKKQKAIPEENLRLRKIVADNIRMWAQRRGLSINILADRSGVSRAQMFNVLRTTSSPSVDWINRVAPVLGIPVWRLLVECDELSLGASRDEGGGSHPESRSNQAHPPRWGNPAFSPEPAASPQMPVSPGWLPAANPGPNPRPSPGPGPNPDPHFDSRPQPGLPPHPPSDPMSRRSYDAPSPMGMPKREAGPLRAMHPAVVSGYPKAPTTRLW